MSFSRRPGIRFNRGRVGATNGGGLSRDNFSQSTGVEAIATVLGVANFSQASTVEATATLNTLVAAQVRLKVAAAAVTLSTTMRVTGGASPPVVLLAAGSGSLSFGAGLCPKPWVDILPGALTFDLSFNSGTTIAFAAQTIPVGGGNYTIPSGTYAGMIVTFPLGTYDAASTYEGAAASITSTEGTSYVFSQATAAAQPVLRDATVTPDGKDALFFAGAQYIRNSDAAVYNIFQNDPAFLLMYRVGYSGSTAPDIAATVCGPANSAGTNSKRRFGTANTGAGRESHTWFNSVGTNATNTAGADTTGNAHTVAWYSSGSNSALNCSVNDAAPSPTTANDILTLTPNRFTIGAEDDNAASVFFFGYWYDGALFNSNITNAQRTVWFAELA